MVKAVADPAISDAGCGGVGDILRDDHPGCRGIDFGR